MATTLLFVTLVSALLAPATEGAKNILFIMADDMRQEAEPFRGGHWGWPAAPADTYTPNLQTLADGGTTFRNAYCQFAICGPSRTSLMTGRRPDTTKVYSNDPYWRDSYDITTFPQHLKNNGFTTAGIGKIFHGAYDGDYDGDSWSVPFYYPSSSTFWKGKFGHDHAYAAIDESNYRKDLMDREIADKAIEYLEGFASSGTKFFLAVGFKLPHLPWIAPEEFYNQFSEGDLPGNCYLPNDLPGSAFYRCDELLAYHDVNETGFQCLEDSDCLDDENTKNLRRAYYASISYVDSLIGELLQTLKDNGLDDDTAIVFTSDHGYQLGEHKEWNKNTNFEIANHVPLIISAPGYSGGQVTDALVELADIYPTVVDLAELDQVELCDADVTLSRTKSVCREGSSLVPLLTSGTEWTREAVFYQFKRKNDMGYTVIKDGYRFTAWNHIDISTLEINWMVHDRTSNQDNYFELYDLVNDPYENTNLATDSNYDSVVDELYEIIKTKGWSDFLPSVDPSNVQA